MSNYLRSKIRRLGRANRLAQREKTEVVVDKPSPEAEMKTQSIKKQRKRRFRSFIYWLIRKTKRTKTPPDST
ncbi:MAG: hypothetical protein Q8Q17_00640 [bacterium]|nr:hypothetical protein [bacterium]